MWRTARVIARVLVGALLFTLGCAAAPTKAGSAEADNACEAACKAALAAGRDLANGPCLSDDKPAGVIAPDFVCDVAHSPREKIDDDPANQCAAFRAGKASHFVEVDPACKLIRTE
jgi:hypothetical protein